MPTQNDDWGIFLTLTSPGCQEFPQSSRSLSQSVHSKSSYKEKCFKRIVDNWCHWNRENFELFCFNTVIPSLQLGVKILQFVTWFLECLPRDTFFRLVWGNVHKKCRFKNNLRAFPIKLFAFIFTLNGIVCIKAVFQRKPNFYAFPARQLDLNLESRTNFQFKFVRVQTPEYISHLTSDCIIV